MAYDINHCRFSGKILDLKEIKTKTGTPMTSIRIQCWKETIRAVAFNDIAATLLGSFSSGSHIEIAGKLQTSKWEHEDKKYRDFQIVVDEIAGLQTQQQAGDSIPEEPPTDYQHGTGEHEYRGGPF